MTLLLSWSVQAQNIVENSALTAQGGVGVAGASKSIGKAIGSLGKAVDKTASQAAQSSSASPAAPSHAEQQPAGQPPPEPKPMPVSPEDLSIGMTRVELMAKFGKPLMKTSKMDGPQFLEIFYYPHPEDDMTAVTLREGKITAISPPPKSAQPGQSAAR
jgi:hypothetical protein